MGDLSGGGGPSHAGHGHGHDDDDDNDDDDFEPTDSTWIQQTLATVVGYSQNLTEDEELWKVNATSDASFIPSSPSEMMGLVLALIYISSTRARMDLLTNQALLTMVQSWQDTHSEKKDTLWSTHPSKRS